MPVPRSRGRVALAHAWALALPTVLVLLATSCSDSVGPTEPTNPVPTAPGVKPPISPTTGSTGSLRIITSTTGTDLDPNGYAALVDSTTRLPIDLNDTVVVAGLKPGTHSVYMDNVSLNCRGNTQLTRSVSIQAGVTTTVTYSFACTTETIATGTIQIVTSTTGSSLDPDGYTYSVDSAAVRSIGINTTVTVGKFKLGNHSVLLGGVASNCTISGSNPRVVNVTQNTTVQAVFSVTCSGSGGTGGTGSIQASVPTTGQNLDPNGYTLTVDGGAGQHADVNASTTFTGLTAGSHSVQLTTTTVANNCSVNGSNPQIVSVTGGQTSQASFQIVCNMALKNQIVFTSTRDAGSTAEIYVMNSDGSNIKRLTNNTINEDDPFPSPDGTKILFQSDQPGGSQIFVMNADGTGIVNLTNDPNIDNTDCNWSPDGTKIAFESNRSGDLEIWKMNADGSGLMQLTHAPLDDGSPTFSPDGSKIAFEAHRDGNGEIYVMNADGSNEINLTNNPAGDGDPSWSPTGNKIAFTTRRYGSNPQIVTMNPDGSGLTRPSNNTASDEVPTWSPDGTKIVFDSNRSGNFEVWVMNADGTNPVKLTNNAAFDGHPSWARGAAAAMLATGGP